MHDVKWNSSMSENVSWHKYNLWSMLCISKLRHYEMILFHYLFTSHNRHIQYRLILDLRYYNFNSKLSQSKWYYIFMVITWISTTHLSVTNYEKNTGNSEDSYYGGKLDTCQHFFMNFDDAGRQSIHSINFKVNNKHLWVIFARIETCLATL